MPTELYDKIIKHGETSCAGSDLTHKLWDHTPWVIDVFFGGHNSESERSILDYCFCNFGPEAWPIHGKPGNWYRGGATVDGSGWIGFHTAAMMEQFTKDNAGPSNAKNQGPHEASPEKQGRD